MKRQLLSIILVITLIIIFQVPAWGLGMENPADLAISETIFELAAGGNAGLENNLLNYNFLNADMTDLATKEQMLGRMENGIFKFNATADSKNRLTIGRLSLGISAWESSTVTLSKGVTDVIFYGTDVNQTYDLTGSGGSGLSALSLDLSYGLPLIKEENDDEELQYALGVGTTFHLLKGVALWEAGFTSGEVSVGPWGEYNFTNLNANYKYTATGLDGNYEFCGDGFLVDLGAVYWNKPWRAGLTIKNIGPPINWKNLTSQTLLDYNGSYTPNEGLYPAPGPSDVTTLDSHATQIPIVLEAAGSFHVYKLLALKTGVSKGLSDGWGVSATPRFWAGADLNLLGIVKLAGEASLQGKMVRLDSEVELRLIFLWMKLRLGCSGFGINNISGGNVGLALGLRI